MNPLSRNPGSAPAEGPPLGCWLAAHRADGTLGKTGVCILEAKFYGRMSFLSPTRRNFRQSKNFACTLLTWAISQPKHM